MVSNSSAERNKSNKADETASKKLDFLLDTVDNEVADLANVVDTTKPTVDDVTSEEKTKAASLDDQEGAADSLELDIDLFGDLDGHSSGNEPEERQAQAALDAMSDTEGEIEAMLAEEEKASEGGDDAAATISKKAVDHDLAKGLGAKEQSLEVCVHGRVPRCFVNGLRWLGNHDTRVVYKNVDSTELSYRGFHRPLYFWKLANVAGEEKGMSTRADNLLGEGFEIRMRPTYGHNFRTRMRQGLGYCVPNTFSGSQPNSSAQRNICL